MIIEVFFKGSNFKRLYDTFWNIRDIHYDGTTFVLITDNRNEEAVFLDSNEYELRVSWLSKEMQRLK